MSLNVSVSKVDLDDSKEVFKPQPDDLEPSKFKSLEHVGKFSKLDFWDFVIDSD